VNTKDDFLNVPNCITLLRIMLIPVFCFFIYNERYFAAAVVFLIAGLTDIFDGYMARKLNKITSWGKLLDPVGDKIMQLSVLLILTVQHIIPVFILYIVAIKELLMIIGGILIYRSKNLIVTSNWYGKAATLIFYIAVTVIVLIKPNIMYTCILIGIAVVSTLFAFFMYIEKYRRLIKR